MPSTRATPTILLADDQADVLEALRLLLKAEGYATRTARSPQEALQSITEDVLDLVLMDLNYARDTTSGQEGLELLGRVREKTPELPVVVMTAWGTIELAVEAIRQGARDFIEKPWDNGRLLSIVQNQLELAAALRKSRRLEAENRLLRGDGAPDLLVNAIGAKARLLKNVAPDRGHWVAVRAFDPGLNRDAIGAEVTVRLDGARMVRFVSSSESFLSAGPAVLHFGLGNRESIEGFEVAWPDGSRETFPGGPADRLVELRKGSGKK